MHASCFVYVLVTTRCQWRIAFTARDPRALRALGSRAVKYAIYTPFESV